MTLNFNQIATRDEDNEMGRAKKRVVREAFGSGSDTDGSVKQKGYKDTMKKRQRSGSERDRDESGSRSAQTSDSEGKPDLLKYFFYAG